MIYKEKVILAHGSGGWKSNIEQLYLVRASHYFTSFEIESRREREQGIL
jgi:hypothetical protein